MVLVFVLRSACIAVVLYWGMSKSITIRLDDDFADEVKRQAEEMGTSVTGLITDAVRRELDPDRQAFLQAAADFNTPENWAYVQERFGKKKAA